MRITRVYTRTGDAGKTRLAGGQQVWKDSLRVAAYGSVDELNALVGRGTVRRSRKEPVDAAILKFLTRLSDALFVLARWIAKTQGEPELLWERDSTTA